MSVKKIKAKVEKAKELVEKARDVQGRIGGVLNRSRCARCGHAFYSTCSNSKCPSSSS